tara:strand:+ start:347 stop:466 length:120 start_codon:yes stop_codon:yes gene_type:complete
MAYSQTLVVAGGIAHVPFIIAILKIIEKRFLARLSYSKS